MSYVKSRERLVFGYFSLLCWKRKFCEKLVFGDFVENRWFFTALRSLVKRSCLEISWMISGLSQLCKQCKVSWKACVWRFYWNDLWSFETLQSLVKRSCLEIFLKCSLVFRSYVKSRERHVFRDILENLWLFTALVSPTARVCRYFWKSLVFSLLCDVSLLACGQRLPLSYFSGGDPEDTTSNTSVSAVYLVNFLCLIG